MKTCYDHPRCQMDSYALCSNPLILYVEDLKAGKEHSSYQAFYKLHHKVFAQPLLFSDDYDKYVADGRPEFTDGFGRTHSSNTFRAWAYRKSIPTYEDIENLYKGPANHENKDQS